MLGKNFVMKFVCIAFLSLILFACGDSNPLIGSWKTAVDSNHSELKQLGNLINALSDNISFIFTEKELIVKQGGREDHDQIQYRKNSDKSWSITTDGGKVWNEVIFVDNDTIELARGVMGLNLRLKRMKN
ncbi:MAG: hypothetical protein IJU79_04070 [Desulfovibrionaceae bacterium]|nr:hypothetical protein [Desulfovibrionaceae bacterium]